MTSRTNIGFGGDGCSDFAFEFRYDYEMWTSSAPTYYGFIINFF